MTDMSVYEPTPFVSHIKRNQSDCPSTPVEGVSSKLAHLAEDIELKALTHSFWLPVVLPPMVHSTPEKFDVIEDITFVRNLSMADRQSLFADASRTLFRAEFLVSMVDDNEYDALGCGDLSIKKDELKGKCETLEL
ncbi:unnamed protein product [Vicia faba]|uniref:Uncharacterized protein n=1 Tax=Vicia faba TaxID=3906 RepID=A0AAV0Z8S2_VICFA|nr:unnamed protein product [Vicia faba]